MITSGYRYELRHDNRAIATGHLDHVLEVRVGDEIEIAGSRAIVEVIEPIAGQNELRLVVALLDTSLDPDLPPVP